MPGKLKCGTNVKPPAMCCFALLCFPDAFVCCGEWRMSTSETPHVQYVCYSICVMPFVTILVQHTKGEALAKMEGVSFTFRNFWPHIRLPLMQSFKRKVKNPQGMPSQKLLPHNGLVVVHHLRETLHHQWATWNCQW